MARGQRRHERGVNQFPDALARHCSIVANEREFGLVLPYKLVKQSDHVKYHYEHAKFATLQPFTDAWKNYWPAYVQGSINTDTFLQRIAAAAKPTATG